jgi:hypothetical protein
MEGAALREALDTSRWSPMICFENARLTGDRSAGFTRYFDSLNHRVLLSSFDSPAQR